MKQYGKLWLTWCCSIAAIAIGQSDRATAASNPQHCSLSDILASSSSKVLIAAHRGGYENDQEDEAPENSLANIRNCARKGYELFETDIQRTKDGHFVIVHDPTLTRETSGVGKVAELTLLELQALQKRYRNGSLSSERIATLGEFLKQGKGHTVFKADLKPGVSRHFDGVMKLVAKHDALNGIIFRVPYREADLFEQYLKTGGPMARHTLMFKVSSKKQIKDIKARFNSSTIEIKLDKAAPCNDQALELIRYATANGFSVETHAEGDEGDWANLIKAGVRIFHTSAPSKMKKFLHRKSP